MRYISIGLIGDDWHGEEAVGRSNEAMKKRLRAGRLLLTGKRPAEVALAVGVARQTVYTWKRLLDEGGIEALRAVPGRGRPAKLDGTQLEAVRRAAFLDRAVR